MASDAPLSEFSLAYVTCPNREEALRLGRAAVSARLAACANVVPGMTSVYEWKGQLCEENEAILLLKTTTRALPELEAFVLREHPYETPCFLVFGVDGGSPGFLDFLRAGVGPRGGASREGLASQVGA